MKETERECPVIHSCLGPGIPAPETVLYSWQSSFSAVEAGKGRTSIRSITAVIQHRS